MSTETTLVIGYGNPGRLDDGLGPELARRIEALRIHGVKTDSDYQLTVEDAADIARYDNVVFADAAIKGPAPFGFKEIEPWLGELSFSSHSYEPEAVLGLAHQLFKAKTRGFALGIRGYAFDEFGEALSDGALRNLEAACRFLKGVLENGLLADAAAAQPSGVNIETQGVEA